MSSYGSTPRDNVFYETYGAVASFSGQGGMEISRSMTKVQSKDLKSGRLIGKGPSGIVYETTWEGKSYARKDFLRVPSDIFEREAAALVGLDHPNVLRTYCWTVDEGSCSLVVELMDDDLLNLMQKIKDSRRRQSSGSDSASQTTHLIDLHKFIKDGRNSPTGTVAESPAAAPIVYPFDLPEALKIIVQVAEAVKFLHDKGVAHGDLKPMNILVTSKGKVSSSSFDENMAFKVADFGLFWTKMKSRTLVSRRASNLELSRWRAPELLELTGLREDEHESSTDSDWDSDSSDETTDELPQKFTFKDLARADIYTFALTCSQILTGEDPYPELRLNDLVRRILGGLRPGLPPTCPARLRDLLNRCWGEKTKRPSFEGIFSELKDLQASLTKRDAVVNYKNSITQSSSSLSHSFELDLVPEHSAASGQPDGGPESSSAREIHQTVNVPIGQEEHSIKDIQADSSEGTVVLKQRRMIGETLGMSSFMMSMSNENKEKKDISTPSKFSAYKPERRPPEPEVLHRFSSSDSKRMTNDFNEENIISRQRPYMGQGNTSLSTSTSDGNDYGNFTLQPKHKVFLSHSGAHKRFVEQLCVDLEKCDCHPFFDKHRDYLPIGKDFPRLIFEAIEKCEVGVVVLSEEFFTSKRPMLELVAMTNVKKRKPSFTIMPIFWGISLSQCRDVNNHRRWLSLWHIWVESDSRIDLNSWANALQLLGRTNALKFNFELGEVKFREEIVEAICMLVPSKTRFEDSHIQGRSRLCKVIHERIKQSRLSSLYGVHVLGLHGVGGIGKTTLSKAICNDIAEECRGKVAHVELGSQSEEELLKEVLMRLMDMNLKHLGVMNIDQVRHHLMRALRNVKVFLTIDNVSGATTKQALTLLRANYGPGSVVLVTARSLNELVSLRIDANECMEMPELEIEEAKSLFLFHAKCVPPADLSNKADHELISSCVEKCHFKKGDGISYHYHPLVLQALGEQLGYIGYVPSRWWSLLHETNSLNLFQALHRPIFSILRRSFDALHYQDQLLFMDAALFAPYSGGNSALEWNVFDWLGMIHGIPVKSVIERLENLKRKSLLENLGDGLGRVGMNDLWLEFARLETKVGKFEKRRWIFEWDKYNALEEASMPWAGGLMVNVRRIFFLDKGFMMLDDVNFACFPNVTVLKLSTNFGSLRELDLRGLTHLKSLELECTGLIRAVKSRTLIPLIGLGSLLKLGFLRWLNIPTESPCMDEISDLINLRVLDLDGCGRVPDLSRLIFLQVACFRHNDSVATIDGLSWKHTNLQYLDLSSCTALQSCEGVGELVALQELRLDCCYQLKEVPNLQKLKQLRKLHVLWCKLLPTLPGLGDLVSLLELHIVWCQSLTELPDLRNLRNLRVLNLQWCELIKSLPCLDELVCLQSLTAVACKNLTELPDMSKLTNLQTLELDPKTPYIRSQSLRET